MQAELIEMTGCRQHPRLVLSLCIASVLSIASTASGQNVTDAHPSYGLVTSDFGELSRVVTSTSVEPPEAFTRTAAWPFFAPRSRGRFHNEQYPATPHPAVARIIAPERGATAFGSGTLVDVRDQFGLVVTNWHVVRDATAAVEVAFPDGFRSHARPLKVDKDWDLAALVIWRPSIEPVTLSTQPPRPGDALTIHGYGQGQYRIATGRCTQYYAPHSNYPLEMLELDVEARQGDSGGPIFNQRGELAGVLFGAGQGTTFGSFGPRVGTFLATLAPDIGQVRDQAAVAVAERPAPNVIAKTTSGVDASRRPGTSSPWTPAKAPSRTSRADYDGLATSVASEHARFSRNDVASGGWYEPVKSLLAVIGLAAIAMRLVKMVR